MKVLVENLKVGDKVIKEKDQTVAEVTAITETSISLKFEDGSKKNLKAATVARWYDVFEGEVKPTEEKTEAPKKPKKKKPVTAKKEPVTKKPKVAKKPKVVDISVEEPAEPKVKKPAKPKKPKAPVKAKKEEVVTEEKTEEKVTDKPAKKEPKKPAKKVATPKAPSQNTAAPLMEDLTLFLEKECKGAERVETKVYVAYKVEKLFLIVNARRNFINIRVRSTSLPTDLKKKKSVKIVGKSYKWVTDACFTIFDTEDLEIAKELIRCSYNEVTGK